MKRAATIEEILTRETEIWAENWKYGGTTVKPETKRRLRVPYRMMACFAYGFEPLIYDDQPPAAMIDQLRPWMFARQARCLTCQHVLATNQPSWMRKHARAKHGVTDFPLPSSLYHPTSTEGV